MTIQEVKAAHPLPEVAASYGLKIGRNRMVRCPFHPGDRNASLQLYPDHFYCFGCGAHGDVIDFVSRIEGVDFKTAFLQLGGSYEENPAALREAVKSAQNQREVRALILDIEKMELQRVTDRITVLRADGEPDPYSDEWCELQDLIMKLRIFEDEYTERKKRK